MAKAATARFVLLYPPDRDLTERLPEKVVRYFSSGLSLLGLTAKPSTINTVKEWRFVCAEEGPQPKSPSKVVAATTLTLPTDISVADMTTFIENRLQSTGAEQWGTSLPIHLADADFWCPHHINERYGTRAEAETLVGAKALTAQSLTGEGVNVVVVDQGVGRKTAGGPICGWTTPAGPAPGEIADGHGDMIVRNIRSLAPKARIFDCPLIPMNAPGTPAKVADVEVFLDDVVAAWTRMISDIRGFIASNKYPGRWVIVNAWYVSNTETEKPEKHYSDGPKHMLNLLIDEAVDLGIDVIFCAGNCGPNCPDDDVCGAKNRGPGESIVGANSHPRVITVGGVRTDGVWIGYSSEGPGQPHLGREKPDICAPSHFSDTPDSKAVNTGTSAATGIAGGVIAALRSGGATRTLTPEALKELLIKTADKRPGTTGWNGRYGHGLLNAKRALAAT